MVFKPGGAWFVFMLIAVGVSASQVLACEFGWCSGVLVGDVVSLSRELDDVVANGSIGNQRLSYIGVILLYWLNWKIAPFTTIIVNSALIYMVYQTLYRLFRDSPRARAGAFFGVVVNPYLWFVASGPNKEIPLLLITTLYAYVFMSRESHGTVYALLLAVIAAAFRDGYGALLAGLALLNYIIRSTRKQVTAALICAVSLATIFSTAANVLPVMKRNLEATEHIAETHSSSIVNLVISSNSRLVDIGLYVFRLAANSFSLPIRPQFLMTDGLIYPLGVAIWFFGIVLAGGLLACVGVVIFKNRGSQHQLAGLVLQLVIAVSVSLFVQPRYLMAALPLMTAVYASSRLNQPRIIAGGMMFSFLVAIILIALGAMPPPATGVEERVPSFLQLRWNI